MSKSRWVGHCSFNAPRCAFEKANNSMVLRIGLACWFTLQFTMAAKWASTHTMSRKGITFSICVVCCGCPIKACNFQKTVRLTTFLLIVGQVPYLGTTAVACP